MEAREFVPLAPYTTFKIGGLARYFCDIRSLAELRDALTLAKEKGLPTFILGGGSNVLIADAGFPGVVLHMMIGGIAWEEKGDTVSVTAGAGVGWDDFVKATVAREYFGVENLSGIPGSVGASVIQNIGAYGAEVSEVVERVEVYDANIGTLRTLSSAECAFGYRNSIWKHEKGKGLIVTGVRFHLRRNGAPNIAYKDLEEFFARTKTTHPTQQEVRDALIAIRSRKFPDLASCGTAGSFFKHPVVGKVEGEAFVQKFPDAPHFDVGGGRVKLSAGWIIDHVLGLRGVRRGKVGTRKEQALALVNYGGASAQEVKAFAREIQDLAAAKANIKLEPEVVFVE